MTHMQFSKVIKIGLCEISENSKIFIIAEAGVNHNGKLKLAKKMIDMAKWAGADAVKFQTFKTENLVTKDAPRADYQKKAVPGKIQFKMLKELELSESEFEELRNHCRKRKIMFLSTPFDFQSAEFLNSLSVPAFKISSGDLTNIPFLVYIAKYNRPIILSTGMSTLAEVREAVKAIYFTGNKNLILLHCTSSYPTRFEDVNLKAIDTLKKEFDILVGYSDHTQNIEVAVAAVAMGVRVIEKHFTLDKGLLGPDHKASLEPDEFKRMAESIKNIEKAMGDGIKKPRNSEQEIKKVARKSIITAMDISEGTEITQEMLTIKRPGIGIEPKFLSKVLGKKIKKDVLRDKVLTWNLLQ